MHIKEHLQMFKHILNLTLKECYGTIHLHKKSYQMWLTKHPRIKKMVIKLGGHTSLNLENTQVRI
jgi:hypothetical protein